MFVVGGRVSFSSEKGTNFVGAAGDRGWD